MRDAQHGILAALTGLAISLVLVHAELGSWFALSGDTAIAQGTVPMIWAVGALAALALCSHRRDGFATVPPLTALAIAGVLVLISYDASGLGPVVFVNVRFASVLATAGAAATVAHVTARRDPRLASLVRALALAGLGLAIGAEAYAHYDEVSPRHAQTALSIAWSCYAAVLIAVGFARDRRSLRLGGLGLIGLVAAKLVLIDLDDAAQIYRVLSFLIVGALMIGVSYGYHRVERRRR